MVKVFPDANYFIDLVEQRKEVNLDRFKEYSLFLSPLSIHILVYVYKYKIPNKELAKITDYFSLVSLNGIIIQRALLGPTADFEDNIHLHSASYAECNIFLTSDKMLLKLGYFGNLQLLS